MSAPPPRLLVAIKPGDPARAAIDAALPDVPWAFEAESTPAAWGQVEVLLLGSFAGRGDDLKGSDLPNLKFVQGLYTGLDGFPFDRFAPEVEIAGNVGGYAPFVAEQALVLALAAARDLNTAREMVQAGRLRPAPDQRTLLGATAAILGYGAIGAEIASRLRPFGARLLAVNRSGTPVEGAERTLPGDRFRELLPEADVVFEVRPLTRRTEGSLGRAELDRMRETAILVNVGRAATVDPAALYEHLRAHPTFRAAFDVWWEEDFRAARLGAPFPLATLPNFFATPHCASALPAAQPRALASALVNLARYFRSERPLFIVDRSEYAGPASAAP